jgi:hypothetical protein
MSDRLQNIWHGEAVRHSQNKSEMTHKWQSQTQSTLCTAQEGVRISYSLSASSFTIIFPLIITFAAEKVLHNKSPIK